LLILRKNKNCFYYYNYLKQFNIKFFKYVLKKKKKYLIINGIFEGHITGIVEIIKDLVSLGHSITCYILDSFADRLKKTGSKLIIYHIDKSYKHLHPKTPPIAINMHLMYKAYEQILSEGIKSNEKYDFLIVDHFLMEEN